MIVDCRVWRHSQVVRQRSAKPPSPGSNPGAAFIVNNQSAITSLLDTVQTPFGAIFLHFQAIWTFKSGREKRFVLC